MKKLIFMSAVALAMAASCAAPSIDSIPQAPLEECVYNGNSTAFSVWAPTAEAAQVKLYHSASDTLAFATVDMKLGKDGLWKAAVNEDVKGSFYAFQVKHSGEWLQETAGIGAKAVGVNGWRGAVIDWTETNPEGWAEDKSPEIKPSDIIVYEMHHRDFSVHQTSGISNKGKYLTPISLRWSIPVARPSGFFVPCSVSARYFPLLLIPDV